jgi:hypothetical protein
MKARLGCSPDWADALYLTFAHPVAPLAQSRGYNDAAPWAREALTNSRKEYDPLENM